MRYVYKCAEKNDILSHHSIQINKKNIVLIVVDYCKLTTLYRLDGTSNLKEIG